MVFYLQIFNNFFKPKKHLLSIFGAIAVKICSIKKTDSQKINYRSNSFINSLKLVHLLSIAVKLFTSQNLFLSFCVCVLAVFQVHEFDVLFLHQISHHQYLVQFFALVHALEFSYLIYRLLLLHIRY